MERQQHVDEIVEALAILSRKIEALNSLNLTDLNIHSENFFREFLNRLYGLNLTNVNIDEPNAASIDLGDSTKKWAVQVTATASTAKVRKTVEGFVKRELFRNFDRLIVLQIGKEGPRRISNICDVGTSTFTFETSKDIWDIKSLCRDIAQLPSLALADLRSLFALELPGLMRGDLRVAKRGTTIDDLPIDDLRRRLQPIDFGADRHHHTRQFIGRQWLWEDLKSWLADEQQPVFWLHGPSGVGKTAFCCWLSNQITNSVLHLCSHGNNLRSSPTRILRSIAFHISEQLPSYAAQLRQIDLDQTEQMTARSTFDLLLVQPLFRSLPIGELPLVLVLDAIDECTESDAKELASILAEETRKLPNWIRFVVSTRSHSPVAGLLRGSRSFHLTPESNSNISDVRHYVELTFQVDKQTVEAITASSEGLFLYVNLLNRDYLSGKLSLLNLREPPGGLDGYFAMAFNREFGDREQYKQVYRQLLELVVAAPNGIPLELIAQLTGWDAYEQREYISTIQAFCKMENAVLRPHHRAVCEWLASAERSTTFYVDASRGHVRLADVCWDQYRNGTYSDKSYCKSNLCVHLAADQRWVNLAEVLTDLTFLDCSQLLPVTALGYWRQVESESDIRMIDKLRQLIETSRDVGWCIIELLRLSGNAKEALECAKRKLNNPRHTSTTVNHLGSLHGLSLLLNDVGDPSGSLSVLKTMEQISRSAGYTYYIGISLGNQATIYLQRLELDRASAILSQEEHVWRSFGYTSGLALCLANYSNCLRLQGKLPEAISKSEEAVHVSRVIKTDISTLQTALSSLALNLFAHDDKQSGDRVLAEAEELCRQYGLKTRLIAVLAIKAVELLARGQTDEAFRCYSEHETLCLETKQPISTIADAWFGYAEVESVRGNHAEAVRLYQEAAKRCSENNMSLARMRANVSYASSLSEMGEYELARSVLVTHVRQCEAASMYQFQMRAEFQLGEIATKAKEWEQAATHYSNSASLAKAHGEREKCLHALLRAEDARRQQERTNPIQLVEIFELMDELKLNISTEIIGGLVPVARMLGQRYRDHDSFEESLSWIMRVEALIRRHGCNAGLIGLLEDKSGTLRSLNRRAEARTTAEEMEQLSLQLGNPQGVIYALQQQIAAADLPRDDRVLHMCDRQEQLGQQCGIARGRLWAMVNRAHLNVERGGDTKYSDELLKLVAEEAKQLGDSLLITQALQCRILNFTASGDIKRIDEVLGFCRVNGLDLIEKEVRRFASQLNQLEESKDSSDAISPHVGAGRKRKEDQRKLSKQAQARKRKK